MLQSRADIVAPRAALRRSVSEHREICGHQRHEEPDRDRQCSCPYHIASTQAHDAGEPSLTRPTKGCVGRVSAVGVVAKAPQKLGHHDSMSLREKLDRVQSNFRTD